MTVAVAFDWDEGWFAPYSELILWHDLCVAMGVDIVIMIPDLKRFNFDDITLERYSTMQEAIDAHPELTKVFLEPKSIADENNIESESITTFDHPEDAMYIFGNSARSNIGLVDLDRGDKVVYVPTVVDKQIWSIQVVSIVLYDRAKKQWLI